MNLVLNPEVRRIVRHWTRLPLILMIAAICVTGAQYVTSKPKYTATTSVVARNLLTVLKPLKFEELAPSLSVAEHVREELRLSESAADIARQVKAAATQSSLYRVSVTDPVPDRAVSIANAVSQEAAKLYTNLATGTPATTATQVSAERATYQERYLAAAQRLLDFEAQHPDVMVGTMGSEALPPDLQSAAGAQIVANAQGGTPSLQPLSPPLATTDAHVESQFLALQLAAQLAADAYHNFEAETAKNWVTAVGNAHDYGAEVVDPAVSAEPDTSARRSRVVYAGVLALLLGFGVTYARDRLQRRLQALASEPAWPVEPSPTETVASART